MTAPARPRMRDGLVKRGGVWYFVLDEPRDPATGKRRQKWVKGGRTREEAKQVRDDARARRKSWKAPTRTLLGPYLTGTWLPAMRSKVAPATWTSYHQNLAGHVAGRIGHVRLDALDAPTLDALYADLEAAGLARSTVRLIHTQLHRASPMRSGGICWRGTRRISSTRRSRSAGFSRRGRPTSSGPSSRVSLPIASPPSGNSPRRQGCVSGSW